MKQVLIISSSEDSETQSICRHLRQMDCPFFLLYTDRLHNGFAISCNPAIGFFELKHLKTGQTITEQDVAVVWWVRHQMPANTHQLYEAHLRDFIDDEFYGALVSVLSCLPNNITIINDPVKQYMAGWKPYQQRVAASVGFRLPQQLISNQGKAFLKTSWHQSAVYKPIFNSQYIHHNKKKYFATVREINQQMLSEIRNGTLTLQVHHFQEKIEVAEEYRVTVFGNTVAAFKIEGAQGFDWRLYLNDLRYTSVEPFYLSRLCLEYNQQMQIQFGCFDIIRGTDDQYYFIECNSPGYFLFLDPRGKHKLAHKFATYLYSFIG